MIIVSKIFMVLGLLSIICSITIVLAAWFNPDTDWEYREEEDDEQVDFIKKWREEREQRKKR